MGWQMISWVMSQGETVVGDITVVADYKSCKRLAQNEDIGVKRYS